MNCISRKLKNCGNFRATEKAKIYKDKISQLSKQNEEQKELLRSKETTIENLLARMDELMESISTKNNEINSMKEEMWSIKADVYR